ncbi:MAG: oligoendopeptidase F [Clostridiales bacterium]|nr:oligoendopeptidase F [Clostridiales bacterium]
MGARKREEQNLADCWALEDLFASDEQWEKAVEEFPEKMRHFSGFAGHLGEDGETILKAMQTLDDLNCAFERIYVYANQKYHQDTGNGKYQEMAARTARMSAQLEHAAAFVEPELLAVPSGRLETFFAEEAGLEAYRRKIGESLRMKAHILSEELERVLAMTGEMARTPENVFSMFQNADLKFGELTVDGNKEVLTQGNYVRFLENEDRQVRKQAFRMFLGRYREFQNTLAAVYGGNLAGDIFSSRMRKYSSCLEMALDGGNIPTSVYTQLIEAVHDHLKLMYRYVRLRKRALKVEELHMYDVYVPLAKPTSQNIPFSEAKEIVKEGLAILGDDYVKLLEEGFSNRWIDVYENEGKRGGAYSWGAYGTHPYVLLNYQENLNNVFTLAHEMGHALHSYYSDHHQPYTYAGYRIFVAEVASTCNEALLIHHLLDKASGREEKAYLINYFLDQFKGTIYRQTMFAEFELLAHQKAERGEGITAQGLSEMYYTLNKKYFGEDMVSDPEIALEWARIPHFYTPFYVYQYATGFAAAIAISSRILSGEPGAVEDYKKFLSGGSSMDCIDLLKLAGVDMTSKEPVDRALEVFGEYLDKLEMLMDESEA